MTTSSSPAERPSSTEAPSAASEGGAGRDATAVRTAAVVYNPIKVDLKTIRASVLRHQDDAGWGPTRYYETSKEDPGGAVTATALADGASMVIAAGGDGTVRAVAEALRGSDASLALLPSGTGNLLARNLSLTLDRLDDSIATAFRGRDRDIDLGVVDIERENGDRETKVFVVMAGVGLDAKMLANTNDELKRRVGWLAYVDAIARALRDDNKIDVRYQLDDGETKTMSAHTIIVGNCGLLPANIMLLPDAAVDDGIFDIVALRPEGVIGWAQIWIKIVWENGVLRRSHVGRRIMAANSREVRTLRYNKGKKLVVRLESAQDFEIDGDSVGKAVALRAVVDPGALTVRVPA
ncbi:diacylglycerol kinase family protein [Frigoribacterium sp. CFBP9039]|uniref:diacylglycerol/lipid kinase family protein n=1 Tax=unclassified Frigoribacterium TaxID=2627005 RepID=UPI0017851CF2|nr:MULTISPECIES: diacylglycerol kinase family protein [unclassified Frigoribacterium]MBD8703891.1 diacylglycerol kinase [Frigoribacterium sp. CFBP 13712]MDY0892154.1 diacylglycerol kinase family protein [Frigoribacterium sp. CFBP9030]MDY0946358.1 diacylglycerol kinase family protein [Frigoribacterium sp. CFBP9039]